MKTQQQLAEQVVRILGSNFPLYDTDASIHACMADLHKILPGKFDIADVIVTESIRSLAKRGLLGKNSQADKNLRELKSGHPEIEWCESAWSIVIGASNPDLSLENLEYQLAENFDALPKSATFHAQVAANNKAQRDVQEAEDIRAWALELFQTNKKAAFLKNSNQNHHAWNVELSKQVKRFQAMDINQLRALKAQYSTKAELAAQAEVSIAERKSARFNSPTTATGTTQSEHSMYPRLPEYFYQGLTKIPYDRDILTQISKLDPEYFRSLCLKYGPQIGERMQGQN